jgi:spermidine synthase
VSFLRLKLPALWRQDVEILLTMAVLAGCGLIYEYLLSHYTGRVLGAMDQVIFTMIGLMIVSMGVGAWCARLVKDAFTTFVWTELCVAFLGASVVLMIASMVALSEVFPRLLAMVYGLPDDLHPVGGVVDWVRRVADFFPYFMGVLIGFLLGLEIPLMARIREQLHARRLSHNTGTLYGADYLGAGLGAVIWVWWLLQLEISRAAVLVASVNWLVGLWFFIRYRKFIQNRRWLLVAQGVLLGWLLVISQMGLLWTGQLEALLYQDDLVFSHSSRYQHVALTKRWQQTQSDPIYTLYLNGRTQFSSSDEHIYHAMLVMPAMLASNRQEKVLIIGGGDGLALRDVLTWDPDEVTLMDLDEEVIKLFSVPREDGLNAPLLALNQQAFSDPRVDVVIGDAFIQVDKLLQEERLFDVIIVDLPDPGHPDLNRLYSTRFYTKLKNLLMGDGAISIQSTSPYHAKQTFLCIGKTVEAAGFSFVQQMHQNVPSFGEWGWTLATRQGASPKKRIQRLKSFPEHAWLSKDILLGAFAFGRHFYDTLPEIKINHLGSWQAYQYHQQDWMTEQGALSGL